MPNDAGRSDDSDRDDSDRDETHRDETEAERLDRNYNELLQEMRVLQAGVQILFAFMLTIPFQTGFDSVSHLQLIIYLVSLVAVTVAAASIIGPVPFHRFVFRRGMKADLMKAATQYVVGGLVCLFVAMVGAVSLVLGVLIDDLPALLTSTAIALVFVVLWVVVPLIARSNEPDDAQDTLGD
jgi:MFS family permease